jgi:hypothetical protein
MVGMALLAFAGLCGCSTSPPAPAASRNEANWLAAQGGVAEGQQLVIATKQLSRLTHSTGERAGEPSLRIHVLNRADAAAYCWPSGDIYLSRGLVDHLSEDELAAAIAHELGHLILAQGRKNAFALLGSGGDHNDVEHRADLAGCQVLAASGVPESTMAAMLRTVLSYESDAATRAALTRRINLLAQ